MAVELSTPSFKPREYEGEKIEYLVYGLDDEGNEIECIDGPVDTPDSAAELAGDILKQFPGLYFHVTAVLNDANGKMKDSEVVWSNFPEDEAKGANEKLSYEKGHKNSKGEDAPWVIRDHKGGKVLASFAKKAAAEAHLERMRRYSKSESTGAPYIQRCVITGGTGPESGEEREHEKIDVSGDPEQQLWDMVLKEIPADYEQHLFVNNDEYDNLINDDDVTALKNIGLDNFKKKHGIDKITSIGYYTHPWSGMISDLMDYRIVDEVSQESESLKKEAENHMKTMKRYSKTEGKFTEIKAAIKAAWSAAEAKWFRLDFREATERLDVYPIASDNEGVGVNWGVLPARNTIVQYATDLRTGDNQIEREMPYKDLDELEKIFVDEFKSMDETLEVGADNGADIHPLTENRPTESEVDKFLYNALDWASIDDGKNRIILKFIADAGAFDLIGYDGKTRKTLKSGELFSVVDRYRELVEMDQADAIREFEKE